MIKNGLLWVVFVLMTAASWAQKPTIERPDTRKPQKVKDTTRVSSPIDSLFKAKLDAPTAKDTAFGKTAKKVIPKTFYNVLFRDIDRHIDSGQVAQMEQNPHLPFAGRWIREIYIHSLDVLVTVCMIPYKCQEIGLNAREINCTEVPANEPF